MSDEKKVIRKLSAEDIRQGKLARMEKEEREEREARERGMKMEQEKQIKQQESRIRLNKNWRDDLC